MPKRDDLSSTPVETIYYRHSSVLQPQTALALLLTHLHISTTQIEDVLVDKKVFDVLPLLEVRKLKRILKYIWYRFRSGHVDSCTFSSRVTSTCRVMYLDYNAY